VTVRAAGWLLGVLAAFCVYLRLAGTRAVNADGAAQALQAWDMLHGNPLLHGWTTSDVSFYTTELPQYMLVELGLGLRPAVVHVAAAMTYTLVVLLAALLARGSATGREAALRMALTAGIMAAPQLGSGTNVLLSSPDHTGTAVPLLAAWLILDRARPGWRVPVAVSGLLALALVADSAVLLVGVIPLVTVCAYRVAVRGARGPELALGGGAVAATGLALAVRAGLRALGGYAVSPLGTQLAPLGQIVRHNLPIAARCLLLLPGADIAGLAPGAAAFFVAVHLAGVALAGAGIVLALPGRARRGPAGGGDLISELLLAGIAVNLLAFVVSTHVYAVSSAREIAPVLPLAAALAGRQLARRLTGPGRPRVPGRIAWPVLSLVLAGYLAGLGLELTAPAAPPQQARLTAWLEAHRLGSGLSGYWEASIVTLTSADRVAVRPLDVSAGRVVAARSEVRASWYEPGRSTADFVVLFPGIAGYPGFTGRAAVVATFGPPARTYHVGPYTILAWHRNLLTRLSGR
jgi:hypothetical protein